MAEVIVLTVLGATAMAIIILAFSGLVNRTIVDQINWENYTTEQLEKCFASGVLETDPALCRTIPSAIDGEDIAAVNIFPLAQHHLDAIAEILTKRRQAA